MPGHRHRSERRATGTPVVSSSPGHVPRLEDIFRRYTDPATFDFTRNTPLSSSRRAGTALVSRSEAKRRGLGAREFDEVELDFSGVDVVGQGFCDEVFRVFGRAHPEVVLEPVGMNDTIAFMVGRARAAAARGG